MGIVTISMLLALLLLPLISAADLKERGGEVTPHWEEVCDTSLLFSEDIKSWDDATGFCKLLGGNLMEIRSMELDYCILLHAHHKGLSEGWYWHSGNDIDDEGVYRYNRAGDFITWSPLWLDDKDANGEPNGARGENCFVVHLSSDRAAGKWADASCTNHYRYICQRNCDVCSQLLCRMKENTF